MAPWLRALRDQGLVPRTYTVAHNRLPLQFQGLLLLVPREALGTCVVHIKSLRHTHNVKSKHVLTFE